MMNAMTPTPNRSTMHMNVARPENTPAMPAFTAFMASSFSFSVIIVDDSDSSDLRRTNRSVVKVELVGIQ